MQVEKKLSSTEGRLQKAKAILQWRTDVEGAETPLYKLRKRIVFFLGSLGGSVNSSLIETGSAAMHAAKVVAWDNRNKLEFAVPFQDMKPSIYLGVCACACMSMHFVTHNVIYNVRTVYMQTCT